MRVAATPDRSRWNTVAGVEIRFARSASRHRLSRSRIIYEIEHSGRYLRVPPGEGRQGERLVYLGHDEDGIALEVIAVQADQDTLYVIHATPLRRRYFDEYERLKQWRIRE